MAVSFIDLRRFESGFQEAWQRQVAEMSARAEFIGGQSVSRLEDRLREATGALFAQWQRRPRLVRASSQGRATVPILPFAR